MSSLMFIPLSAAFMFAASMIHIRCRSVLLPIVVSCGTLLLLVATWTMATTVGARNAAMNDGAIVVQPSIWEAVSTSFSADVVTAAVLGGDDQWMIPGVHASVDAVPVADRAAILPDVQPESFGYQVAEIRDWFYNMVGGDPGLSYAHVTPAAPAPEYFASP